MSGFADTHAHLHDEAFSNDLEKVLDRARESKIDFIVDVGTNIDESRAAVQLAEKYPDIYAVVGVHPHYAKNWTHNFSDQLIELATNDYVVGIGEIGLDFFRNLSTADTQQKVFIQQLEIANSTGLPVVIHSRNAHEETYNILASWVPMTSYDGPVGVIHCFSGDANLARRYTELGFIVSFAGPVTYPKNEDLRKAACEVSINQIVIETDCPYLPPQFYRGKRNEPSYMLTTGDLIADVRGDPVDFLANATTKNAHRLFRIPTDAPTKL